MNLRRRILMICGMTVPLLLLTALVHPVAAQTESLTQISKIETLSNEIVRAEIRLSKIGTAYNAAVIKPNNFRNWRTFAYKTIGSTLTNAGIITIAASRYQYANDPARAPRPYLKAGHIINLTAASVIVCGTSLEVALDKRNDRKLMHKGFTDKSALSQFLRERTNLSLLLKERAELLRAIGDLTIRQREVLENEELVLKDIYDLVSNEFIHSSEGIAKYRGERGMANATTLMGASTAGYMGSLNSLLSVANRAPKQTGVAGLGFIAAGSIVAASPLVVNCSGTRSERSKSAELAKSDISETRTAASSYDHHRELLKTSIGNLSQGDNELFRAIAARIAVYEMHNDIFDSREQLRLTMAKKSKCVLTERVMVSSIVGGSNIARGALLAVAGFHYFDSPKTAFKTVAAASTVFIAGSGVWTADNIQGKVREEAAKSKMAKMPATVHGQLLNDLDTFEDMENQMSLY